jgi:serine/threonine protein kinase
MELCSGGDLYSRIPYVPLQVADIVRQMLGAVSFLHARNIIHRDIKMEVRSVTGRRRLNEPLILVLASHFIRRMFSLKVRNLILPLN